MTCDGFLELSFCVLMLILEHKVTDSVPVTKPNDPSGTICNSNETECFSQGKLLHHDGRCYNPLDRGPCPEGQWLIFDIDSSMSPSRCVERQCPPEEFPVSGSCVSREDAQRSLCAGAALYLDPTGNSRCGESPSLWEFLGKHHACVTATETPPVVHTTAIGVNWLQCAYNDKKMCEKEVIVTPSSIVLEPEY